MRTWSIYIDEVVPELVKTSEWATRVVPVVKGDGSVRICGDFKVRINHVLHVDLLSSKLEANYSPNWTSRKLVLHIDVKPSLRKFLTINIQTVFFSNTVASYPTSPGTSCIHDSQTMRAPLTSWQPDNSGTPQPHKENFPVRSSKCACAPR